MPPDKIAIDFSGHRSSGIAAIAYAKLRDYLGLTKRPIRMYDVVQQLAIVDEDVLELFGVDTVEMGRGFCTQDKDWKEWVLPDGTPCQIPFYVDVRKHGNDWAIYAADGQQIGVQRPGCLYFEQTYWPWEDKNPEQDDFEGLEKAIDLTIWAAIPHPGAHLGLGETALKEMMTATRKLRESTDRAIVGMFGGNLFELPQWLFKMENYLTYMGLYPEAITRLSERLCELHLRNLEKWLGAMGPYLDVIVFGDDLGGQNGPLLSPTMYRQFYKPYHAKLWRRAKELAKAKVMLHCCGGVQEILGDLIEAGLEAINPVQTTCKGMDPAKLKREFGKDIVFWGGGCDTRTVLAGGTPAEVARHVRHQIQILNQDGGFVFQQVHNVLANVPARNIEAMFKAIRS
jgi:uroporphyrinogen decarboxylase